ncbi:hypothetical protein ES288_D10G110100v1 [Gossypium darwinii]|uniref:Uncharacterized protein n=1 Tax=Gossypium darwinii TaxID=34276 RepID=A0A5D2AXK4_GOSDA|nr:hypothetical protein ES288_D10G110100v1 [Gossypium darwinii]
MVGFDLCNIYRGSKSFCYPCGVLESKRQRYSLLFVFVLIMFPFRKWFKKAMKLRIKVILRFRKKTLFKHFTLETISHLLLYWVPLTLGKHLSLSLIGALTNDTKGTAFPFYSFYLIDGVVFFNNLCEAYSMEDVFEKVQRRALG